MMLSSSTRPDRVSPFTVSETRRQVGRVFFCGFARFASKGGGVPFVGLLFLFPSPPLLAYRLGRENEDPDA